MESSRPLWRVIRPMLLATAAATSWLAISATAASADSPTDGGPLTEQVLSSVTAIAAPDAAIELPQVPRPDGDAPSPGLLSAAPKLQTLAGAVTSRADALVATVPVADVPVVGSALTLPALTPVTDPVLGLADDAVSAVTVSADFAVASVVDGVAPVLGAVTGPVAAVVTPPELPAVPSELPGGTAPAAPLDPPAAAVTDSAPAPSTGIELAPAASAAAQDAVAAALSAVPCGRPAAPNPAEILMMSLADDPADERAPGVPDPAPGVPGSGSGAGAPSGGNANPAWLSSFRLHLSGTLNVPARGDLLAPPSPVSFDPGSSPD